MTHVMNIFDSSLNSNRSLKNYSVEVITFDGDSYTEEMIIEDLKQFEGVIVNLVVYDHSQAGEEFMASFGENGVSRTWKDRDSLFVGVFPFVKML